MSDPTFAPPTLAHVMEHGGKFCASCEHWSAATPDTEGETWERCCRCGHVGQLRYYPPALQPDPITTEANQ